MFPGARLLTNVKTLADVIKERRDALCWSQADLARKAGVYAWNYESPEAKAAKRNAPSGPPRVDHVVDLPNSDGRVYALTIPEPYKQQTRCLIVSARNGNTTMTCEFSGAQDLSWRDDFDYR